jgi:hypothetical protein
MTDLTSPEPKGTALDLMRAPFPANQISKLPKPYKKDSERGLCSVCGTYHGLPALHLDYVGHAAITARLLDADPCWGWEPMALGPDGLPQYDRTGGLWIRLTVGGVTRIGYGNAEGKQTQDAGARDKEVIGDALRNAAMRFGTALELWHKGDLYGPAGDGGGTDDDHNDTRNARQAAMGNANGAAPPDQRSPAAPPPGRRSAAAAKTTSATSTSSVGVTEGQAKNLLAKIKSLDMTPDQVDKMLARVDVPAIGPKMSLADWKAVKAELDSLARAV